MDDRQIVDGVRRGDRDAIAALYDRYADVLHDYARRRTASAADAADIVHDAFLVAVERIGQLRDPDRLRPWLYAIARTELHRGYRHAARFTELETTERETRAAWEPVSTDPGPDTLAQRNEQRNELVALLREATAGLTDADRDLLDLHLRHGLAGADLAAAAGMPARHASVALDRVTSRLARTIGVVLLARRPTCPEFVSITRAQPGLTPLTRKRLARHVDDCEVCHREQSRRMRPEVLLGAVPVLPVPAELRHRLVASTGEPAQTEAQAQATARSWDHDGFPSTGAGGPDRRLLWWVGAGVAAFLVILGAALMIRPPTEDDPPTVAAPPGPTSQQVLAPTVAPTTRPAPPTATSTAQPPSTTTSTTTVDTEPPTIDDVTLTPREFTTTFDSRPVCAGAGNTAAVSAVIDDRSAIDEVTLTWSYPDGTESAPVPLTAGDTGHRATIGPVPHDALPNSDTTHPVTVTITAVDAAGNGVTRTFTDVGLLRQCAIIF